ncbi:MAG: hypothetical protein LBM77_04365 [Spirochaetaceae bacterium]|jgi:transcription antitermination factor NusG|nr:hypothetical protein [Spirochaetaceae bacterium]
MSIYCLFCETGKEITVEDTLGRHGHEVIESHKERLVWKKDGKQNKIKGKEYKPLIPGYIFFKSEDEADALFWQGITAIPGVYYPLKYGDDTHALRGNDLKFAIWLETQHGVVKPLKAFKRKDGVVISEGPLKEMCGTVIDINPKRECAKIQLHGEGLQLAIWLQYEMLELETNNSY